MTPNGTVALDAMLMRDEAIVAQATPRSPDESLCVHWSEAYERFDVRIRSAQTAALGLPSGPASAQIAWWLANFEVVRDALYDLHEWAVDRRVRPWIYKGAPLVTYLTAAYVWCGDAAGDLESLVSSFNMGAWQWRAREVHMRATEEGATYIDTFLEPYLETLKEECATQPAPSHPLAHVRDCAERLEREIVSLSWSLTSF